MSEQQWEEPKNASEEFDISTFDFTVVDPGETPAEPLSPREEEPKKPSIKRRLKTLSSSFASKVEQMMEEKPKKEKPERMRKETTEETEEIREDEPKKTREKKVRRSEQTEPAPLTASERVWTLPQGSFSQICRRWVRYALRPSTLYHNINEGMWPLFLGGIGIFFAAFYLLIGLDWLFASLLSPARLWAILLVGALVGGASATFFALGVQVLGWGLKKEKIRPFRVLSAFAGACVCPSVLLILGFLIQIIFKVSVSMSFGVTAVLWLTYTLVEVLRDMFGEKKLFFSTLLVILWGFVTFLMMTFTFTLK